MNSWMVGGVSAAALWSPVAVAAPTSEAKVVLFPYVRLTFPAVAGNAEPPEDGTALDVFQYQRAEAYDQSTPTARMEGGADGGRRVVIEGLPPGFDWGRVTAPDGRWGEWRVPSGPNPLSMEGAAVRFHASRDVAIRLTEPGGIPVADAILNLVVSPRGRPGPSRTDASGLVTFPRLAGQSARVFWTPAEGGYGLAIGEVDLQSPPGVTEIELPPVVHVRLTVTIDGEARLPSRYTLSLGEAQVTPHAIHEDPDRAELSLAWRPPAPDGELTATLQVPGYPAATAVLPAGSGAERVAALAVAASARVTIRVLPPPDGKYWLFVERLDRDNARWYMPDDPSLTSVRTGRDGVHLLEGPHPGTYRLRDHQSGEVSNPFDVEAGAAPREIDFDLRSVVALEGRVVVPEGESFAFANVFVRDGGDHGAFSLQQGRPPEADGTFPVRAPRGSKIRLRVTHPILAAVDPDGREFVVGTDPLVLELRRGPEVRFRVPGVTRSTEPPDPRILMVRYAGPTVRATRHGMPWAEAKPLEPIAASGLWRMGLAEGTWDLWMDVGGGTPLVLREVVVGEGATDLGEIVQDPGAVLRLRLTTQGRDIQRLPLVVEYLGEPAYSRSPGPPASSGGDVTDYFVRGLAAGRFRVRLYDPRPMSGPPIHQPEPLLDRTIETDGRGEIVLEATLP